MSKRMILTGSLLAGLSAPILGQTPVSVVPQTAAAQCRLEGSMYQTKKLGEFRNAGTALTPAVTTPVVTEAKRLTRACAAKIAPDGAGAAELSALSSLYLYTGDTAMARNAVTTLLGRPGLSESDRADGSLAAEQLAIAASDPFAGINAAAERNVADIDQLSDAVLVQKVRAHQMLLGRYEYADIDDGLRDHAGKLLVLAQRALQSNALGMTVARAGAPSVSAAYQVMVSAYSSLARGAGDFLHADSALMILDEADRVLDGPYPFARRQLEGQRAMYALVGSHSTPINGKWWVNGDDGATFTPGKAKVTVIQFTAHWCVPCKNSYPGMIRMNKRFDGKPVESILVTDLYGFIGDKQKLTPTQEVAEDRDYYAKHHALPFKVAINPSLSRADTTTQDNNRRYAVGGIPEIVVVDRKGIIRAMVVGWDQGNEQRLSALIEKILSEKQEQ